MKALLTPPLIPAGDAENKFLNADLVQVIRSNEEAGAASVSGSLNRQACLGSKPYIVFLNEGDRIVQNGWLSRSLEKLESWKGVGAAVLTPFFQFRHTDEALLRNGMIDIRFRESSIDYFGRIENIEILAGRPIICRRHCFKNLSGFDGDLGPFFDLDLILRIRKKGWRVLCLADETLPRASVCVERLRRQNGFSHRRSRLFYVAKNFPARLPSLIHENVPLFSPEENPKAFQDALLLLKKIIRANDPGELSEPLPAACRRLAEILGERAVDQFLSDIEISQGYRKLSFGIYDHALQTPGGGQKYACTIASVLQDDYDITFISNKSVTIKKLQEWYGLDLGRCRLKIVKIPFFEKKGRDFIDQGLVTGAENPFDIIAEESRLHDIFMNVNMLTKVKPKSAVSVFLCHFPDSKKTRHFAVDQYTYMIANSRYTIEWLKKRWKMSPSVHVYPPVDMIAEPGVKERVILSVARFDATGSKKQIELVEAFERLRREAPAEVTAGWKLALAGGSYGRNPYLQRVRRKVGVNPHIELYENLPVDKLKALYAKAAIFWHACGLGTDVPERIEHFGMATVEAMQNGCVPVVINKGGQREIVEHGVSGFLFDDIDGLCDHTRRLMVDGDFLKEFSKKAFDRGKSFSREGFDAAIRAFFLGITQKHFNRSSEGDSQNAF